ncbi:heat shock 70 kDa protein 16 isoform X2 [Brassica rapa]|uniref:heat shock 70 kDa protein 16 isoform X2 n=1 Tax=Brassica campestris TaxID=3711 RepID=UPI00142E5D11|nr:heat shock 70 kDa protein 16 isoform X2 [Brassica rapa]
MLSSLFKRELGRTVNASECVARGCAMLSPVFRVRDYEIGPFQISHGEAARVKVRVQLNLHGIVSVDSASLIEGHKENMTSEEMISENNHQSSATKDDTSSSTNDPKAIKRTEIPVVGNVSGALTKDELLEAKQRENSLVEKDLKMESTKDKKNALESFVYEMRDRDVQVHWEIKLSSYQIGT